MPEFTPDRTANSHAGVQRDMHGLVMIEWREGLAPGWFYTGGGTESGPFETSKAAFEAASQYGD